MFYTLKIPVRTCTELIPILVLFLSSGFLSTAAPTCDSNAVFQRVDLLIKAKQFDRANQLLDQLRACPTRSPLESFQLGWLYGRARSFNKAVSVFQTVPRDVPDPLTHDYAIALSRFELAQYQAVINLLEPRRLAGTADAKSVNLLAVAYSKLGLYREAYAALADQIGRDSSDLTTYLNLVTVCAEGGNLTQAANVAAQAQRLFPDSADVLIVKGAVETQLGHLNEAHDDFAAGAQLAPTRADARFFVALIDYKRGRFTDAVSVLQTAVKDGIVDSDLHYLTAECLLKLDSTNTEPPLNELNRAVELNANSVSARTLRGKLLLDAGHPNEALADLEFANRRDPESRSALYNLARAYRTVGRKAEAQKLFDQFRSRAADTLSEFSDARLNDVLTGNGEQKP